MGPRLRIVSGAHNHCTCLTVGLYLPLLWYGLRYGLFAWWLFDFIFVVVVLMGIQVFVFGNFAHVWELLGIGMLGIPVVDGGTLIFITLSRTLIKHGVLQFLVIGSGVRWLFDLNCDVLVLMGAEVSVFGIFAIGEELLGGMFLLEVFVFGILAHVMVRLEVSGSGVHLLFDVNCNVVVLMGAEVFVFGGIVPFEVFVIGTLAQVTVCLEVFPWAFLCMLLSCLASWLLSRPSSRVVFLGQRHLVAGGVVMHFMRAGFDFLGF